MKIKFDEQTIAENKPLYAFLNKTLGGTIKSFNGNVNELNMPIGECEIFMQSSKHKEKFYKVMISLNEKSEFHGKSIVTLNNKQSIVYNFSDNGFAEIEYPDGGYYIGEVVNFSRHGLGSYINKDGLEIEGVFKDGIANGSFKINFKDGETAQASYINGKLNGIVKKKLLGSVMLTANFHNGELKSAEYSYYDKAKNTSILYKMTSKNEDFFYNICGEAEVYFNNTLCYTGEVKDFAMHGEGVFHYENGEIFEGHFNNNQKEGYGTLFSEDGVILKQGYWKNNKFVGEKKNELMVTTNAIIPSLNPQTNEEIKVLKDALNNIEKNIVGQKSAINQIANNLILAFLCEKDETKPLSSILMTGPTGVGKTETAKQMSEHLFGKKPFTIDFGNFHDDFMISSLIGAPSGYKGYDETPAFLQYLEDNKETGGVILFDELDKADEDCYNVFMHMLDEGEIISARNIAYKVNNFIIIGTTNTTANNSRKLGFSNNKENDIKDSLVKSQTGLKKEQVARYNIVVEYEALTKEDRIELCKREIAKTVDKIKKINGYSIDFDINDEVISKIVDNSNESFGAREIKNKTAKAITTNLAEFIRHNIQKDLIVKINSLDDIKILTKENAETDKKVLETTKEKVLENNL